VNRRLPLVLGALAFATSLFGAADLAEAGRGRVHFSGGVRFSGGVHVGTSWHFARPAWSPNRYAVGGSIYVGPRYYPRPYYVYYPQYVPSYYQTTSYYPVEASSAPGVTVVAAPRPELPKFGIGLFMGGSAVESQTGESVNDSQDIGLVARFRLTPGLLLEGELGKTSYDVNNNDNVRVDRRLGGSLVYEIGAYNKLAPYLLAGLGVQQADINGAYSSTQDFAEIGIGLRWAVTPKFHLAADIRAGSRATVSNDEMPVSGTVSRTITPPTSESDESEEYSRARLSAILYF
jgi:hypothetical protein